MDYHAHSLKVKPREDCLVMKRSVLAYGFSLPDIEGFDAVPFTSDRSMLDADVIAVELGLSDFHADGQYAGTPRLSESSSFAYRKAIQRWKQQVATALELGKTVVFFLTARVERYYYTGESNNQGTPGRPRVVTVVAPCSNYDFLPLRLGNPHYAQGSAMVLHSGADILSAYWKAFGPRSVYQCYFEGGRSTPLVQTKSGRNNVGALMRDFGNLLILPEIQWSDLDEREEEDEDADDWPKGYYEFTRELRDALVEIDSRVRKDIERTEAPAWAEANEFRLAIEPLLEAEILAVEAEAEALSTRRERLASDLARHASLRALLYETGSRLEEAVREALLLLGFKAENFKEDDSEFDALFTSEEGRFLGEVEGKERKPINVDKLSQLHRNIAEDLSREDVEDAATPVLFGNAYRLQPLSERGEFFTQKVLSVAPAANVSLVRTPDLFRVARYIKDSNDTAFAKKCREAIRQAKGAVVKFPETPEQEPAADAEQSL
jgi:hypothetical protein